MNRTSNIHLSLLGTFLFAAAAAHADTEILNSQTGVIQVFVEDENGASVASAPVYISDGDRVEYLETDALGAVTVDLQEGKYTISSAITKPLADCIERSVSHEAHVNVQAKDTTSVVLNLHAIENPIPNLSDSTLKKIGVAGEVAKYLN